MREAHPTVHRVPQLLLGSEGVVAGLMHDLHGPHQGLHITCSTQQSWWNLSSSSPMQAEDL